MLSKRNTKSKRRSFSNTTPRQGYGISYNNLDDGVGSELQITSNNVLNIVRTFQDSGENGIVTMDTSKDTKFLTVNSTLGTRGQLASVNYNGGSATMTFTPNYATPVIIQKTLEGTNGSLAYSMSQDYQPINTGGNINYWTGAARSKDFYGSNAIDVYNNSPDTKLETGDNYGFNWIDTTRSGNMYLKTVIFTPITKEYLIESQDSGTTIWTANGGFTTVQTLTGINGMEGNSKTSNSNFSNLQQLFDRVATSDVCISNDGSSMTFWWNPKVIENTPGTAGSLANQELALIGQ